MELYPAIDLRDGQCVRLYKGDFATTTVYNTDPSVMLSQFAAAGSTWVHMVDLDGAKAGAIQQLELIKQLAAVTTLKLEVGGGIRTQADIENLLASGVARVVIGSIGVSNPPLVNEWFNQYGPDKIVLALDCSLDSNGVPKVRTHGWQHESTLSVFDVLAYYPQAKYLLCTDIGVDGTLAGPSIALYRQIQLAYPQLKLIASGGVGSLADLVALHELAVHGVVIGKALYENRFTLAEALKLIQAS
jgi:phosphoribosylformimino-5-aminoimidazole carboxamide ribotide isomerase